MNKESENDEMNINGKVALVTGGGRGLGQAFALALANARAKACPKPL